jgi:diguanylate cyclase (GGDEF)-like protein
MGGTSVRVLALLALGVGMEVLVRLLPLTGASFALTSVLVVLAAIGTVGYHRQARRATGRLRAGMRVASISTMVWLVINGIWVVTIPLGLSETAGAIAAVQLLSVAAAAITPIGLLLCAPGSGGAAVRLRRAIDVSMIFGALFIIAWQFVFQFIHRLSTPAVFWSNLTMMSIELLTAAISLVLLSRTASHGPNAINLLPVSFMMYAFATIAMTANGTFGRPWFLYGVAAGYLVATYATAWGSWSPMPVNTSLLAEQTAGRWLSLPYLPVVAAFVVAGVQQARAGTLGPVLPWVLLGTASIMLLRQFLNARSHQGLLVQVSAHRAELAQLAVSDPLTGLGNRMMFTERSERALESVSGDCLTGVIVFDLDGFKSVNDTWGHAAGDELLRGVARRMAAQVRATDTVVRFGGDEFVVLLPDLADSHLAEATAQRVLVALAEPMDLKGTTTVQVRASAGVAVGRGAGTSIDMLLSDADAALYQAKSLGKGRVRRFGAELPQEAAVGAPVG